MDFFNTLFHSKYKLKLTIKCILISLISILCLSSFIFIFNIVKKFFCDCCSNSNVNISNTTNTSKIKNTNNQTLLNNFFNHAVPPSNTIVEDDYFNDVVFIGDSITNGIQLYKTAKGADIISKTGLNIESIIKEPIEINNQPLSVLQAIKQSNKNKIYIMVGSNGIGWLDIDYMVNLYKNWLTQLRSEIPNSIIYVQSVFPITKELSDYNQAKNNCLTNSKIDEYNNAIFNMCKENYFFYLNVAEAFKGDNGCLPKEASPIDGMHINSNYYNIWLDYIKTHTIDSTTTQNIQKLLIHEGRL